MRKINVILAAATMASAVALAGSANATVMFSFTPDVSVSASAPIIQNFNGATIAGLTGTNYQLHAGSPNDSTGAAPNASGTQYLAVLANGAATYTLGSAISALQFDWGTASIDNVLTVFTTDSPTTGYQFTVPGSDIPNGAVYNKNGRALVTASAGTQITGLRFAAGSNSFEVDNIAGAVPEPASWAMMVGGFGLLGAAMRRRGSSVARFA